MSDFKREIKFAPAFDKRDPNPRKNYGIHGVECLFSVAKDGKGISFTIYTHWMLPHVQAEMDGREPGEGHLRYLFHKPQPAGVDYHDSRPHYEDQRCREHCDITGGKCYSDGSCTLSDEFYETLVREGSEGVFKKMEALYAEWLADAEVTQ